MFSKLTEGLQSKLADLLLSPTAFFWLAGLFASLAAHRVDFGDEAGRLSHAGDAAVFVASFSALALVAFSSAAFEPFNHWFLDRLAGYWGRFDGYGEPFRRRLRAERRTLKATLDAIRLRQADPGDSDDEIPSDAEIDELEKKIHYFPVEADVMATRFGCALVAADRRIYAKYGLSANICWPALSLAVSETVRSSVATAQGAIEASSRLLFWSVASLVWLPVWPHWFERGIAVVAAGFVAAFAYVQLEARGREFADVFENAFDVGRFSLYRAMRLPLPATFAEEAACGRALTTFVLRGFATHPITYHDDA